jgi:hypothetical protein
LVLTAARVSWIEARKEIDFYVKEIGMLRVTAPNRTVCLCRIYVLLRDGSDSSWRSAKLENRRVIALTKALATIKGPQEIICSKCGTGIHGTNPCAFGKLSDKKAKSAGRKVLLRWAEGDYCKPSELVEGDSD